MYLTISRRASLVPNDPNDWLHEVSVDIECWTKDGDLPILAGRMSAAYLNLFDAQAAGASVLQIFDARSADFESLYSFLFETESDEFNVRFDGMEVLAEELIYVEHCILHPALKGYRRFVIDQFCNLFGSSAVVAIWDTPEFCTVELSDTEFLELGFSRLAEVDVRVRSNELKITYDPSIDRPGVRNFVVPESAAAYVDREWEQLRHADDAR